MESRKESNKRKAEESEVEGEVSSEPLDNAGLEPDDQKKMKKKKKKPNKDDEVEEEELKQKKEKKRKKRSHEKVEGESSNKEPKQKKEKKHKKKVEGGEPKPRESKEMKHMREVFERIRSQITESNKHLLTIADFESVDLLKSSLELGEILLSWRKKNPELICAHAMQKSDDCWAHALARALAALMKQLGVTNTDDLPTAEKLVAKIDKKLLTKTNALDSTIKAAPSILEEYGYELSAHHRPKMHDARENEAFEKYIERQLAIGPVAMCFPYVEGYERCKHKNKEVFRPSASDFASMRLEKLDDHCAVITGRGMVLSGGELIEFWEIQETRGGYFGDRGFTRLERGKGLITEVYEFKRVR